MRLHRLPVLLGLLFLALPAFAQASLQGVPIQDARLRLVSNDATIGGDLIVAIEIRITGRGATTLGSTTLDVAYDPTDLGAPTFVVDSDFNFLKGYGLDYSNALTDGPTTYARVGITSGAVGPGQGTGSDVPTTFTEVGRLTFEIQAGGEDAIDLFLRRSSLSVGYFESTGNSSDNGEIDDNTADGVCFQTVGDLATRTMTLTTGEGWRMLGSPVGDQTLDDLLGPLWTQGFAGADAAGGTPNVAFFNEPTDYVTPSDQSDGAPRGIGLFAYIYSDNDNDGSAEGFPKSVTVGGDPVNGLGAPACGGAPDPYDADFPYNLPVTFTDTADPDTEDGWNLLANPFADGMDWDAAGWTKTNMDASIYVWDDAASMYLTWNGTAGSLGDGELGAFQGFWAKANAAAPALMAPAAGLIGGGFFSGRTAAPLAFQTNTEALERASRAVVLGLQVEAQEDAVASAQTHVMFSREGARTHDVFDAYALASLAPQYTRLYTVAPESREGGSSALSINALPQRALRGERTQIALAFEALTESGGEGTYTLTWPELRNVPEGVTVLLTDTETGAVVNLADEASYTFTYEASAAQAAAVPQADAQAEQTRRAQAGRRTAATTTLPARVQAAESTRFTLRFLPPGMTAEEDDAAAAGDAPATANSVVELPTEPALHTAYPNPFTSRATLRYDVAEASPVSLVVYDALGRVVAHLVDGTVEAGRYRATFDADQLASGLYIVRMTAGSFVQTQRLTLVR